MNLWVPFFLALFIALYGSAFFPDFHLMPFAPFLALVYQRRRFLPSLWIAFFAGLIMDCITCQSRFGLFTLNFLLTTLVLYRRKRHFFEDHFLSLPIFTFFISVVSTLLTYLFLRIEERAPLFSLKLCLTDFITMPLFDALYAIIWFYGPIKYIRYIKKTGIRKLFFKEDHETH